MTREDIDLIRFKFKEWLALTVEERSNQGLPVHMTGFAQNHGITRRVLTNWQREFEEDQIIEGGESAEKEAFLKKIKPFALSGKNSRYADLYMKGKGWLIERKQENVKVEYTIADRQKLTAEIIEGLKEQLRNGGVCPVCGFCKTVCNESLLPQESEHAEDREVETLALSSGLTGHNSEI